LPSRRNIRLHSQAAIAHGGVNKHQGLATIQLFHDGNEMGIAQIDVAVIRVKYDAVGRESLASVTNLSQAGFNVGQRERGKHAEAMG
jgi:hypothetical protein